MRKLEKKKYIPDTRLLIENVAKESPATRTTPATAAPTIPESKLLKCY